MDRTRFEQVIIVGVSGMLAAASAHIARHVARLTVVSRSPLTEAARLGAQAVALDWTNRQATLLAVATLPKADFLLSWLHDDGTWLAEHLEALLVPGGRSIRVHGANSRDPAIRAKRDPNPRSDVKRQIVMLGWVNEPIGARWLSNDEISVAVIEAIISPERKLVVAGTVEGDPPRP